MPIVFVDPDVIIFYVLLLVVLFVVCHCGSNCRERGRAGTMKLGPVTGDAMRVLPETTSAKLAR